MKFPESFGVAWHHSGKRLRRRPAASFERSAVESAALRLDKIKQRAYRFQRQFRLLEDLERPRQIDLVAIDETVGFDQRPDRAVGEAASIQPHEIDAARARRKPLDDHERRNVLP